MERFPDQLHEIQQEADLCRAMLEGYFEWLQETGSDEGFTILGDEQIVEAPLGDINGIIVMLRGKLDVRLIRQVDGARLFMDHKSVGNFTEPVRTLNMDEQMLMYHLLEYLSALALGAQDTTQYTMGGLYNMLRKVKRTSQAKPPFFDRVEVHHNINELRSFYLRVHGMVSKIMQATAKLNTGTDPNWVTYPTPNRKCTW